MGQGIAQIVVYAVVLIGLSYLLGVYMAHVYAPAFRVRWLSSLAGGFYRLVRNDPTKEQERKSYAKTTIVFTIVFFGPLYLILRQQRHLFLNPDHLKGVPSHISLNTTASFVTNTNWQYYGGEYTMSYLSQMAGLALQQFVSAAVGMAGLLCPPSAGRRPARNAAGQLLGDPHTSHTAKPPPLSPPSRLDLPSA